MKKKIVFLIRDLGYGGAQRQLITLVKNLDKDKFDITVIFFYADGFLQKDLEDNRIQTICLEKRERWDIFGFIWRLFAHLKRIQPDYLHGYLSESNLLTLFLKPFLPSTFIIWGIRDSNISLDSYDWLDRLIFELECLLSRFVDLIIVNSHAGHAYHLSHGFPANKMVVIPNGIDTERFQPNLATGLQVRTEWKIPKDTILIGLIGRLDPMKDHPTFLKAAALLCQEREDVRFVCVGTGSENYAQELYQLTNELGISEKVIWAGGRADMSAIYNALDITCSSSSYGEGFSNVIGEAMACGVPSVVTDVGDSAWIIGDTGGVVVPPSNPEALKTGIASLINFISSKDYSSKHIRQRVISDFSVLNLSLKTQNALLSKSLS
ncbi:MAG: glycosyltransferase [Nostoc sp. ChiSLP02]|nr:glycosyltransferase [Nostoc sp. DedSLP05]MDZ8099411.1 glycosyltransferase [Nostoc sp. DedSLP01]MDZ8184589.1 glycosyltransferase [Nostoc sp. ChiSLP02]